MNYYVVIDTNVIVAALISKNNESATVRVINAVLDGTIIPLYHKEMIMHTLLPAIRNITQ